MPNGGTVWNYTSGLPAFLVKNFRLLLKFSVWGDILRFVSFSKPAPKEQVTQFAKSALQTFQQLSSYSFLRMDVGKVDVKIFSLS